ncbi:Hypothetical protein A7982_01740 [Minicystis rosea]|nr:Hypothetical protein A7982_01740 [Minicystis rosea]
MEPILRRAFNAAYDEHFYTSYLSRLEATLGTKFAFRIAETPLFLPASLRDRLARDANEIVEQLSNPELIAKMKRAIPAHLDVPRMDHLPNCTQVDFAITRDENGELRGQVVELQAFPSLYGLMVVQSGVMAESIKSIPGLDRKWSIFFSGLDRESFIPRLKDAILGGEDPAHVILLDLDPPSQKTYPDFVATKMLVGIDAECPTKLIKDGRRLFRKVDGKLVPVRRIFNRVVFDELEKKKAELPFSYTEDLDVTWCSHPNWYWTWSKFSLPYIDHPAVPRARYVSELDRIPEDLERYVLKPLFSFAGAGVIIDPTRADIEGIPAHERDKWIIQEKITYEPALSMPDGNGVKAEVRMMFLRAPNEPKPTLVLNLVRLSRGKMLGVDQNKDLTWVGGSVGIWPVD